MSMSDSVGNGDPLAGTVGSASSPSGGEQNSAIPGGQTGAPNAQLLQLLRQRAKGGNKGKPMVPPSMGAKPPVSTPGGAPPMPMAGGAGGPAMGATGKPPGPVAPGGQPPQSPAPNPGMQGLYQTLMQQGQQGQAPVRQ